MPELSFKLPVVCPDCALESLSEMRPALIVNALLTGKPLRLHSHCHDRYWTATFAEREQLRKSLEALKVETYDHQDRPQAEQIYAAN
jgi:hypothetical protein